MNRRTFLKSAAGAVGASTVQYGWARPAEAAEHSGRLLEGFYAGNIVAMKDGSLLTDRWQRSTDSGQTWTKLKPPLPRGELSGLVRLANGDLGYYSDFGWDLAVALGNGSNDLRFFRSSDEGSTWTSPVKINLPGAASGLSGAIFVLKSGRILIVTYSQFLTRQELWGASWGTFKGVRVRTETEAHFAEMEAVRVYYSDDNSETWTANDGWILGWHDQKFTDSFVEASGVELRDGRVLLSGRSLTGRLYQATSSDRGRTWGYATPTDLMSSDSPGFIRKFPRSDDLLIVWNQISREENRKGFRRCRLSSAVSRDDGRTWQHFKTLEHGGVPAVGQIPPDPDLTPNWGADEVGALPDDYAYFHYPLINFVGNDVFVSYLTGHFEVTTDAEGIAAAHWHGGSQTRVLPTEWFYR